MIKVGSVCYLRDSTVRRLAASMVGKVVEVIGPLQVRNLGQYGELECFMVAAHWLPRPLATFPENLMPLSDPDSAPEYQEPKCPAYVPAKPRPANFWSRKPPDIWRGGYWQDWTRDNGEGV